MSVARQAQVDLEREKKELEDSFARVSEQAQRKVSRRGTWGVEGGVYWKWVFNSVLVAYVCVCVVCVCARVLVHITACMLTS